MNPRDYAGVGYEKACEQARPMESYKRTDRSPARYIVLVAGRLDSYTEEMRFDTRSDYGRKPMTLARAQARADQVLRDEPGVIVYIAEILQKGRRIQNVWENF